MSFLKINTPVPLNIVWAFFSNAELTYDPHDTCKILGFTKYVMGKSITIDPEVLAQEFNIRDEGLTNEDEEVPLEFDILGDRASELPMYPRLLHLIISWNLHPFDTRHSTVRRLDRFWIHHIHSTS